MSSLSASVPQASNAYIPLVQTGILQLLVEIRDIKNEKLFGKNFNIWLAGLLRVRVKNP